MGNVIRWGFWGVGSVAQAMARDLRLVEGASLDAVAGRNVPAVAAFAERHGVARRYHGLEALLADAAIDVVYVSTPTPRHVADCLAAIAAGKPVLCEKPLALDAAGAASVAHAASQRGVFCMEAMWTRFVPAVVAAKRAVDDGELGRVRLLTGDFAYPSTAADATWLLDPAAGGGALLDRGVYLVSLAQHVLGEPDLVRAASAGPEQVAFTLRFASGALAAFSASLSTRGRNAFAIHGETGSRVLEDPFYRAHRTRVESFVAPVPPQAVRRNAGAGGLRESPSLLAWKRRLDAPLRRVLGGRARTRVFPGNGYQFQIEEVGRCLAAGQKGSTVMSMADTVAVMRTLDSLRGSLRA